MYFNTVEIIDHKHTASVILNCGKLKSLSTKVRDKKRMLTLTTSIQHREPWEWSPLHLIVLMIWTGKGKGQ